jgi:hypothetical protein
MKNLIQDIEKVTSNFESKPFSENVRMLKLDFDLTSLDSPQNYAKIMGDISEVYRQSRLLFIYSVLNKVCLDEGKIYPFNNPFQAGMSYSGVMKKEDTFYLLDEDGDFREVFTSEKFTQFIDDEFWEVYEDEQ